MSSNNNDDILTYVNDNIKRIEKYFSHPLSEVKSNDEKKAIILLAVNQLSKENNKKETNDFLNKINISTIFKSDLTVTINEFFSFIPTMDESISLYKSNIDFLYLILKGIKSINEQYNKDNDYIDKYKSVKFIWKIYYYIRNNFFKKKEKQNDHAINAVIISHILEKVLKNNPNREHNFYYGAFKEVLSKYSFIPKGDNNADNIGIKEYVDSIDIAKIDEDKEGEYILRSFLIETFEEKNKKGQMNCDFQMNQMTSVKSQLDTFIKDLKLYDSLDIDLLLHRYTSIHTDINYEQIHSEFINEYKSKNNKKDSHSYSIMKKLFLKFLYLFISPKTKNDFPFIYEKISSEYISSKENIKSFFSNLQILSYYIYITLQYIENKQTLISLSYSLLTSLQSLPSFSMLISHRISALLQRLRSVIPFNIMVIIKKYFNELISFVLFNNDSSIFVPSSLNSIVSKDFYDYCFDIINKIGSRLCYSLDKREKIYDTLCVIINKDNGTILKGKFVDSLIIIIFAVYSIETYDAQVINKEIERITIRYSDEKKKTFVPDIYEILIKHNSIEENEIQLIYDITHINIEEEKKKRKEYKFMPFGYDFKSLILTSSKDYNTIYSHSPSKLISNEETMLMKKRIRVLTPTIAEKTMMVSPFSTKIDYTKSADTAKAVSAFKNLNFQFQNNN